MFRFLAVIILSTVVFSAASMAQGTLPPQVATGIVNAAWAGGYPNYALNNAVYSAITNYPANVEEIMATATRASPSSRDQLVWEMCRVFPHYSNRIQWGAYGTVPPATGMTPQVAYGAPAYSSPPAAAPVYDPLYDPPPYTQTAQSDFPTNQSMQEPKSTRGATSGPGFYLDLSGGITFVQDADLEDPLLTRNNLSSKLSTDTGFSVSGAIGYRFGNNFRSDFEIGYRRSNLDEISLGGFGLTIAAQLDGTVSALSFLLNGYYDIPLDSPLVPYLGAGIGGAGVQIDSDDLSTDDTEYVFAYQLGGGLKFALSPRASLRAAYKFFATSDPEFGTTEGEYMTHNTELGLTYNF